MEQSILSASLQMPQNWKKWLIEQMVVLPSRGTSRGWRNRLGGTSWNSVRRNVQSCTWEETASSSKTCHLSGKQLCKGRPLGESWWWGIEIDRTIVKKKKRSVCSKWALVPGLNARLTCTVGEWQGPSISFFPPSLHSGRGLSRRGWEERCAWAKLCPAEGLVIAHSKAVSEKELIFNSFFQIHIVALPS